jgi:prophage tail gpP-like protein
MLQTYFNPEEIAQLTVNGQNFVQWESVWAQERWAEAFSYFRFTSVEVPPLADSWRDIIVTPCNKCFLSLGGQPAMSGYVIQRQVAYDADRHQIMILGKSASFFGFKSSIQAEEANMDNMGIVDMANKLLRQYGIGVQTIGSVDNSPFTTAQAQVGENIWEYLDRKAKIKKAVLSNYPNGDAVLIFQHGTPAIATLQEGINIKKMQVVFSIEDTWMDIDVLASKPGTDSENGPAANEQHAHASGGGCVSCRIVIPLEDPTETPDLQKRADFEANWTKGTMITANITVQGWFSPLGDLWHAGQDVRVISPMAPLNQVLKVKTCTWTQDDENGTETVLECVPPYQLNDLAIDVSAPAADATPATGVPPATTNVPTTPIPPPEATQPSVFQRGVTSLPPEQTVSDIQQMQAQAKNLPETPIPSP